MDITIGSGLTIVGGLVFEAEGQSPGPLVKE